LIAIVVIGGAVTAWKLWDYNSRLRHAEARVDEYEERYRAVVELANAGVWVTDDDGNTVEADSRLLRTLGYRSGEIRGKPLSDFVLKRKRVKERSASAKTRLAGKRGAKEVYEAELQRRNGSTLPVLLAAKRLQNGNGDGSAAITLITEATGRKQAEQETALLKNEFFALISHELRTPLTSMKGYIELIKDTQGKRLGAEGREYLGVIARNTSRLTGLLADLMLLTQVEAGTFVLECDQTSLVELTKRSVEDAAAAADEAGIRLAFSNGRKLGCWGDGVRIGQVLDNLILNAIKFTPKGGQVDVRISKDGDNAVIEVEDDGPGIPKDESKYLFDRFYRASEARAKQVQGLGLGLAIVKAIVDAHGGKIGLVSEEGKGTRFTVELPRKRPEPGSRRWAKTSAVAGVR
jgi:PAS domain S-box-containing protein